MKASKKYVFLTFQIDSSVYNGVKNYIFGIFWEWYM